MKLSALLSAAVASYINGTVKDLKVESDPQVAGTYALRAEVVTETGRDAVLDFLIVGGCIPGGLKRAMREEDVAVVVQNLEDVQFSSWPPATSSSAVRFA